MHIKLFFVSLVILGVTASTVLSQLKRVEPSLSHDTKRVVYVQIVETGERELWVVNLDGTALNYVSDADGAWTPRFSPDGKKIVFSRRAEGTNANNDIWIVNSDGSGLKQLTKTPGHHEVEPEFTPAGGEIVFVRKEPFKAESADGKTKPVNGGRGVLISLSDGQEVEFLSKDLNIMRIFPVNEKFAYVGCVCDSSSGKLVVGTRPRMFQLSHDGLAISLDSTLAQNFGSRESLLRFRSARTAPRHILEVSYKAASALKSGDNVDVALTDDRNSQSLASWGLVRDFDVAADGSVVVVSGYKDKDTVQKLWLYKFDIKSWAEIKPVQK